MNDFTVSGIGFGADSGTAIFDVFVRMPMHANTELILEVATNKMGLPVRQIELLLEMLKSVPSVRIGAGVSAARAEQIRRDFTEVGLMVKLVRTKPVEPVLSLLPAGDLGPDGKHVCPSCGMRVVLTEERRCPECEVLVDRVDREALLRRRLREQERRRKAGDAPDTGDSSLTPSGWRSSALPASAGRPSSSAARRRGPGLLIAGVVMFLLLVGVVFRLLASGSVLHLPS